MSDWIPDELNKIGAADELQIAALRPDGTLRPFTTIWVVRVGDDLYVRSYRGRGSRWFRSVLQRPEGRIRAGGVTREVAFAEPEAADHDAIDQAYWQIWTLRQRLRRPGGESQRARSDVAAHRPLTYQLNWGKADAKEASARWTPTVPTPNR